MATFIAIFILLTGVGYLAAIVFRRRQLSECLRTGWLPGRIAFNVALGLVLISAVVSLLTRIEFVWTPIIMLAMGLFQLTWWPILVQSALPYAEPPRRG